MAQLSLRERLQPALFDRLIDDERVVTCYDFAFRCEELERLGLKKTELTAILASQGLREIDDSDSFFARGSRKESGSSASVVLVSLWAPAAKVSLSGLKNLQLKPPGTLKGVALQSFCEITARNVVNASVETNDSRSLSTRKLREYVCRDLAALLNSASLDAVVDLSNHPHVQTSVVNFGMPSLAGRQARSADPQQIAATIQAAVQRFEPRLSGVRVTPEMGEEGNETHILAFRIDAQLWGQPVPQQLVLRTSIDIDSGNVSLAESSLG